jgi:hypothetical protein
MLGSIAPLAAALAVLAAPPSYADCADCDGDGRVGIGDLITGVSIVLGTAELSSCAAIDGDDEGSVTIAELIAAVSQALEGCQLASPTPTPTPAPTAEPDDQLPPIEAGGCAGEPMRW